jgi:hypothetical protein
MKRVCTPAGAMAALGGDTPSMHGGFSPNNYGQGKHRRNYFLLIVGAMQIVLSWLLVRTANAGF